MKCQDCSEIIENGYVTIGDVIICPDCYENLTVEELAELLSLEICERNLKDENDIEDFKYRQERGK